MAHSQQGTPTKKSSEKTKKNRVVIAIDPGTENSAFVVMDNKAVYQMGIHENYKVIQILKEICEPNVEKRKGFKDSDIDVACEIIQSFGMPIGKTTIHTIEWIGEFKRVCKDRYTMFNRVSRRQVKLHLCNSVRAKDKNVSQAVRDRFGGDRRVAVGTKKNPGPLYGAKSHIWSALAVGITHLEQHGFKVEGAIK